MISRRDLLVTASLGTLSACALAPGESMRSHRPLIIAHRGASGILPEHTLEAYRLGAEQGADAIEPDLVMSADGVLMARHDHYIGVSTDAASKFPGRRRTGAGVGTPEWFSEDFTRAEFAELRARQPWPKRDASFNDQFLIPSFADVLDLRRVLERELARPLFVYPEIKLPSYFAQRGLDPVPAFVEAFRARSKAEQARIWIQCFERAPLERLRDLLGDKVKLTQLLPALEGDKPVEIPLREIARYAQAIGPNKLGVVDGQGHRTGLLEQARTLGLKVHCWTFRDDVLPASYKTPAAELKAFFALGVNAVFTDFPATAARAREELDLR